MIDFLKIIFNWDYQKKTNNWSSQIRKLLEQSDQRHKFLLKEKCGTDNSLECMLDQYKVKWLSNIGNKPKLRTYNFSSMILVQNPIYILTCPSGKDLY